MLSIPVPPNPVGRHPLCQNCHPTPCAVPSLPKYIRARDVRKTALCRYFMYKEISRMFFFSRYKLWKSFRSWHRYLQRRKCTTVSSSLQERLFILDGDFCGSVLLAVANRCEQLRSSLCLQALVPSQLGSLQDLKVSAFRLLHLRTDCNEASRQYFSEI